IGLLQPAGDPALFQQLAERKIIACTMELVPRTTRAQMMDALSSQSTVAGYKAVLLAANALQKFFPMLMTAAGTVRPARVLVIGAGVAGLQAIATARRIGAVVEAFDTRPVVNEQVKSLGAKFIELDVHIEDAQDAGGYAKQLSERTIRRDSDSACRLFQPKPRGQQDESGAGARRLRLHHGDFRRLRGDQQSAVGAAHAADVRHQRHSWHRDSRRFSGGGLGGFAPAP